MLSRIIFTFLFATIGLRNAGLAAATADTCPDFLNESCLVIINQLIEEHNYSEAMEKSEELCWEDPEDQSEVLTETGLGIRVSACQTLHRLEAFTGNHEKSFDARERAQRTAKWACRNGFQKICSLHFSFLTQDIENLVRQAAQEINDQNLSGFVQVSTVNLTREFPVSFQKTITEFAGEQFNGTGTPPKNVRKLKADLNITLMGDILSLHWKVSDEKGKVIKKSTVRNQDLKTRFRFFGADMKRDSSMLWTKVAADYKPVFKSLVGFSLLKIGNTSGFAEDHERYGIQIRSVEVFSSRTSEFGLLVEGHATKRTVLGIEEDKSRLPNVEVIDERKAELEGEEEATDSITLRPYRSAVSFYGIYSYLFTPASDKFFDGNRFGVHLALGIFGTSDMVAPSARTGLDYYIGRHYAITWQATYIAKTSVYFGVNAILNKAALGSGFILSYSFN